MEQSVFSTTMPGLSGKKGNIYAAAKRFFKKTSVKPGLMAFLFLSIVFAGRVSAQAITSFSPQSGPVGTLLTINGSGLSSPTAFTVGGTKAVVVSNTGSTLVAMVMPGATTGVVSITTAGGTATSADNFTVTTQS